MTRVYALLLLAVSFLGANFQLSTVVLPEVPATVAAAERFVVAALVMLGLSLARREPLIPLLRRYPAHYLVLGLFGITVFNILFFLALAATSPINGALVMATNPLITAVMAALVLGERLTAWQIASLPVALAGVAGVILGGVGTTAGVAWGDLIMIGANLSWAGYNVLARRFMPPASALANTTLLMTLGALLLVVCALASGWPMVVPSVPAIAALVTMGIGGSALAMLFWNNGIARLGAGRTALFLNVVPVAVMLLGLLRGSFPTPIQLIGGAVVIAAVTMAMRPGRKPAVA